MFHKEETPLPLGCLCEQFACSAVVSHDSRLHRFSNKYSLVIFSMKVQDIQFALYSVGQHCKKARTCQGVFGEDRTMDSINVEDFAALCKKEVILATCVLGSFSFRVELI